MYLATKSHCPDHVKEIDLLCMQAKREEFADLAMSIFVKDPPNDPKTLYETRKQGSLKATGPSSPSKHKSHRHEVGFDC